MKVYNLSYQHEAGHTNDVQTTNIDEISLAIDKALEDEYVLRHTIHISTTEVALEGLKQPDMTNETDDRAKELFKFKTKS